MNLNKIRHINQTEELLLSITKIWERFLNKLIEDQKDASIYIDQTK